MAGLPRRIIKVTSQAGLWLPALFLPAQWMWWRGPSLPPARDPRWEARGNTERVWSQWRGKSGAGEGAPGRLPAAVGQLGGGDQGFLSGPLRVGGAWPAPWWKVGLRGSGLGRGPPQSFRPPPGGGRGRAGIAAGPGLWSGVVAGHGPSVAVLPLGLGGSPRGRQPQIQNE